MKTTAFGISGLGIVLFTILAVLQLVSGHTRTVNLQDNLQQALESSLETAMDSDRSYTIATNDELVADVLEGIAMRLDDNCELRLEVNEVDKTLGIISVKATAYYMSSNMDTNGDGVVDERDTFKDVDWNEDGVIDDRDDLDGDGVYTYKDKLVSVVSAERTVILEQYDVAQVGKHSITYQIVDASGVKAMYKRYLLTEGVNMMAPKDPYTGFAGWYRVVNSGGTEVVEPRLYSAAEIKAMPLNEDYVFVDKRP